MGTYPLRLKAIAAFALFTATVSARAFGAGDDRPTYMQTGKAQSITINSNVSTAAVMEDGLFVGHAGAAFDSAAGVHELIVSAPGYVPRLIRVFLAGTSLTHAVNLARAPGKDVDVEIDYSPAKAFVTKKPLATIPSLCEAYNRARGKVSRDIMLACARTTILDDFTYFGRSWLVLPTTQDPDPEVAGKRDTLTQGLTHAKEDSYYWQAEEFYASHPGDGHAATVVAYSAASRQDCGRVLEVALENGSYKRPVPGLIFVRALCFEMANQTDKAARLYLHLGSDKAPAADLLYHLARVQAPINPGAAVKTLRVCTRAHPAYYPCYEAMAQVQTAAGKNRDATATMTLYQKRTKAALALVFDEEKLDPAVVNSAFAERPESFELAAAASLVNSKPGVPREPLALEGMLISDPAIVKQLLPQLEESVAADKLTAVYVLLTRHYPNDPTGWIRLASAYRVGDRCSESVDAANQALTLMQDERRRAALLVSATECLVRLEKLPEAESILLKVVAAGQANWKAYYNLGVVQERLGRVDDALKSFDLAMTGDMPRTIRTRVETKIAHYKELAEKTKKPKNGLEPTVPTH